MSNIVYKLAKGIKVREESFGLLFYSTQNTNLTFIESGTLIRVDKLEKETTEADLLGASEEENKRIKEILRNLTKRGLLLGEQKSS